MKKITFLMVAAMATMLFTNANAQIVKWDFTSCSGGSGNFGDSPFAPATSDANLTVGNLTRNWTPITSGSGAAGAWGGNNFTATTVAGAVTANEFVTFSLTANTGYTLSVSSIGEYNVRRSGTGPSTGQWQYAIGSGSFTNIGGEITWGSTTTAVGNTQVPIDLSVFSNLQGVAAGITVNFRLVVWGATGTGGTFYFNDNTQAGTPRGLVIMGSVSNATQVGTVETLPANIYSSNGNIVVENANVGEMITVYSPTGQMLISKVATEGTNTISTDNKGILIVRCGAKVGKIIM